MTAARGRTLVRCLWGLVAVLVLILIAKFFVADIYRISSASMRPTIYGGAAHEGDKPFTEWVLVRYGRNHVPQRFDLVVVTRPGEGPVVKRVVGLPGESVLIDGGDLLINGQRLPADTPRPDAFLVFDDAHQPVEDYFDFRGAPDGPWQHQDERWILDAAQVERGSNRGMMFYQPEIRDDYLDQNSRRVVGRRTVSDVVLECDFAIDQDAGRLRFQLVEKADTFEVWIYPSNESQKQSLGTSHVVEIVRQGPHVSLSLGKPELSMAKAGLDLAAHEWTALRFSNIDNHVGLSIGQDFRLAASYDANELFPGIVPNGDQSIGPRVGLGGETLRARFRRIRIRRDLHYTSFPEDGYAVNAALWLADDEVFLLGDNSVVSIDSRRFGPVSVDSLAGRPVRVVWPFERMRAIAGTESN